MARVIHHTASCSDHDPITLNTHHDNNRPRRRKKMQRFEEKWVAHADYEELIRTSWTETQLRGSLMYCLFEKIKKKFPHDLVQWGHNAFGHMRTKLGAKQ